jgi:phosphoglycolate phosphatase-like HAD superfamily hydrolase
MRNTDYQMIVLDIDGTLTNSYKVIWNAAGADDMLWGWI